MQENGRKKISCKQKIKDIEFITQYPCLLFMVKPMFYYQTLFYEV